MIDEVVDLCIHPLPLVVLEEVNTIVEKEKRELPVKVIKRKKSTMNTTNKSKKHKSQTRVVYVCKFTTIVYINDEKKHAWLKIFIGVLK